MRVSAAFSERQWDKGCDVLVFNVKLKIPMLLEASSESTRAKGWKTPSDLGLILWAVSASWGWPPEEILVIDSTITSGDLYEADSAGEKLGNFFFLTPGLGKEGEDDDCCVTQGRVEKADQ